MTPPILPQHPAYPPVHIETRRRAWTMIAREWRRLASAGATDAITAGRQALTQLPLALRTRDGRLLLPEATGLDLAARDASSGDGAEESATPVVRDRAQLSLFVR